MMDISYAFPTNLFSSMPSECCIIHLSLVYIRLDDGLVSSGNKQLPEPMFITVTVATMS